MIIIENFYQDSRGNERSAGVFEGDYTEFFAVMLMQSQPKIRKVIREGKDSLHLFSGSQRLYLIGEEKTINDVLTYIRMWFPIEEDCVWSV